MKRVLALAAFAALAGCTTQPGVRVEVQRVEVPVPVACVKREALPAEPASIADKLTDDARVNEPLLAASAVRLRNWGRALYQALAACAPEITK